MKKSQDTRIQDSFGVTSVERLVQGMAGHGWQNLDPRNDNGVDGIIFLRKQGVDTGQVIYAQVKCGSVGGYIKNLKSEPEIFNLALGKEYIDSHKPRWKSAPVPVILLLVEFQTNNIWWVDLKDETSYSTTNKSAIRIQKKSKFGIHSFKAVIRLKTTFNYIQQAFPISIPNEATSYMNISSKISLLNQAQRFYKNWTNEQTINPMLGIITVSRVGWRHIIRKSRKQVRILNSLQLLGVAKEIIRNCTEIKQLRIIKTIGNDDYLKTIDLLALNSDCIFEYKQRSKVQVIIKREKIIDKTTSDIYCKMWFYSVYEPLVKI